MKGSYPWSTSAQDLRLRRKQANLDEITSNYNTFEEEKQQCRVSCTCDLGMLKSAEQECWYKLSGSLVLTLSIRQWQSIPLEIWGLCITKGNHSNKITHTQLNYSIDLLKSNSLTKKKYFHFKIGHKYEVCPKDNSPWNMKNRHLFKKIKIQGTFYKGQWLLIPLQSKHLGTSHSFHSCRQLPCYTFLNLIDSLKFLPLHRWF